MYDKSKRIGMSRFATAASLLFIALLMILLGGCQRRDSISLIREEDTAGSLQASTEQNEKDNLTTVGTDVATITHDEQNDDTDQIPYSMQEAGISSGKKEKKDSSMREETCSRTSECDTTDDANNGNTDDSLIYIDVEGAVRNPGVYGLPAGARVYEAIAAAGGFLPEADSSVLNQAALLQDEDQIRIPAGAAQDEIGYGLIRNSQAVATAGQGTNGVETSTQGTDTAGTRVDGRINLNTASSAELQTLPGIGESKAAAIIAYRESHGSFGSAEEIMQISGIKEGLYSKIKDKICAD